MACYHPIAARVVGINPETGKKVLRFMSSHDMVSVKDKSLSKLSFTDSDASLMYERDYYLQYKYADDDFIQIPCGRCLGCQIDRSREWANRLMMELEYHDSAYFVTLTYDEFHVPISYYGDPSSGEAIPVLTLRKVDVQKWMKRLRKKFSSDSIRFYLAAEYGPTTFRPHYHAILFGLHLDDLVVYQQKDNFCYYTSDALSETWSVRDVDRLPVPIGRVVVAPVTWETCAYCARYVTKKMYGSASVFYDTHNIEPPFSLMSLKPAIGYQWYKEHPGCLDTDFINLKTEKCGIKFRAPGYFRRLYDVECPDESAAMKVKRREFALMARKQLDARLSMSYLDYLEIQEQAFKDRIKKLERNDI